MPDFEALILYPNGQHFESRGWINDVRQPPEQSLRCSTALSLHRGEDVRVSVLLIEPPLDIARAATSMPARDFFELMRRNGWRLEPSTDGMPMFLSRLVKFPPPK